MEKIQGPDTLHPSQHYASETAPNYHFEAQELELAQAACSGYHRYVRNPPLHSLAVQDRGRPCANQALAQQFVTAPVHGIDGIYLLDLLAHGQQMGT